jgi:hypothetical protein
VPPAGTGSTGKHVTATPEKKPNKINKVYKANKGKK